MKWIITLFAVSFVATAASANQIGVQAGASSEWIITEKDGDWEHLSSPMAGVSYDLVLDERGYYGLSFAFRAAKDLDLISQWGVEYWEVTGPLEYFVGGTFENWAEGVAGTTKFLGGGRAGARFEIEGLPFEASFSYSLGTESAQHIGVFFGFRTATSN
jgi:hypothetical protein